MKSPTSFSLEGLLLIDKPEGPTSHDIVRAARRASSVRRIGHTGTLDPFASGLLLLLVGRATRLAEYFHLLPKTYEGVAKLGARTDTDDHTGTVMETSDGWRTLRLEDVVGAASRLRGNTDQLPPAYSAKKVGGQRSYVAARAGDRVDLKPVSIVTHRFEVRRFADREIHFEAEVSTGTYVRALARDLGADLGCYAHLSRLRRTAIGPFHVDMAVSPRDLETGPPTEAGWLSPAEGLSWLPGRQLSPEEIERVLVGQSLSCRADHPDCDLPVPLLAGDRLVAVARSVSGELKPEKVFPGG